MNGDRELEIRFSETQHDEKGPSERIMIDPEFFLGYFGLESVLDVHKLVKMNIPSSSIVI